MDMDGIKKIECDVKDKEVILNVYLDENVFLNEFANEFMVNKEGSLRKTINKIVKENYSKYKVKKINIIIGSLVFASIPFNNSKVEAHNAEYNMSYLFVGGSSQFISDVDSSGNTLSALSPSYFEINMDGSLKLSWQTDQKFINEMHARGKKVVPFLSNHWDRTLGRAALANREELSTQIAQAISKYNLDGINVDIENVTDVDRESYTDLVRLLREKVPEDKEVSVAVAANPNGWNKGWHGSYDYFELSNYADYLMIMAYDESYPGGPEGPVASLPWVEKSITYALSEGVPPEKVVLGIPFFGRMWQEGKQTGGTGISHIRVAEMIAKYSSTVEYDEVARSPKATITIGESDPGYSFAGNTLGPGKYSIWYENEQSIKEKIDLVHKYNLKGTGSWSLGQENPSIWNEYSSWVTGMSPNYERYGGKDRYEVETTLNQSIPEHSLDSVFIASGLNFPDALAGGVLNNVKNGTLLLVNNNDTIINQKINEAKRLLKPGGQVYILGGPATVSDKVENAFQEHFPVERIGGQDRIEVSINVANKVNPSPSEIFLSYGLVFSDSLSIVPVATKYNQPIILQFGKGLQAKVKEYITEHPSIEKVTIVSGTGVIPVEIEAELKQLGISTVERVAGKDRYETSLEIAKKYYPNTKKAALSNGLVYADALSGSRFAFTNDMPILLVRNSQVPSNTKVFLEKNKVDKLYFYGGNATVNDKIKNSIYYHN